jgi:acylphosphatase
MRLGVVGTVRNQPDGTVRVVAEGEDSALRDLLSWLDHGPERASVDRVDVEWSLPRDEVSDFRIED